MEEDDKGLKMTGRLANTTRGREALALLKMTPRPALSGLSIGYRVRDSEMHKSGQARRTIKAADLIEVSLVTFPANSKAVITGVKSRTEEPVPIVDWKLAARADFEASFALIHADAARKVRGS